MDLNGELVMLGSSKPAQRVAVSFVTALTVAATLTSSAHAQRAGGVTVEPVRPPTVRVRIRGKAPTDSVHIGPADIETIEIQKADLAAYYGPWRGCGPIIVRVMPGRWTLESLSRLH